MIINLPQGGTLEINEVPESCIESAEYILQCISKGHAFRWVQNGNRQPHILAKFGNGIEINISTTDNIQNEGEGFTDYNFEELPRTGQGIVLLNKTPNDNGGYNMHFGAVVAVNDDGSIVVTDVSETKTTVKMTGNIPTKTITNVQQFGEEDYPADRFAIGLLEVSGQ